jgi:hypothetical protein
MWAELAVALDSLAIIRASLNEGAIRMFGTFGVGATPPVLTAIWIAYFATIDSPVTPGGFAFVTTVSVIGIAAMQTPQMPISVLVGPVYCRPMRSLLSIVAVPASLLDRPPVSEVHERPGSRGVSCFPSDRNRKSSWYCGNCIATLGANL